MAATRAEARPSRDTERLRRTSEFWFQGVQGERPVSKLGLTTKLAAPPYRFGSGRFTVAVRGGGVVVDGLVLLCVDSCSHPVQVARGMSRMAVAVTSRTLADYTQLRSEDTP